jgi:hypothetical protein
MASHTKFLTVPALPSPDFYVEIWHNLQLEAQIEQCATECVEYMRIIGHVQERDLDDAINSRDFAQLSASFQHPLLDRAGKSTFNLVHVHHKRLLSKPTVYKPTVYKRPDPTSAAGAGGRQAQGFGPESV